MKFVLLMLCLVAGTASGFAAAETIPSRYPAAPRIVAFGDVHGDMDVTLRALRLAGAIDDQNHWAGGDLVVVQTGDQLDRGDHEQEILDLFARLRVEAEAAGGAFHALNGNHELMNARLDLRYVTPGGFLDFQDAVTVPEGDSLLLTYEIDQRARVAAFRPAGDYARLLAERNTVVVVGDNVFAHGGVLPEHVAKGLDAVNEEIRAWLRGDGPNPEWVHKGCCSPTWTRIYSDEVDDEDCATLTEVLDGLSAKRMIVGHTVQDAGITSYCDGRVWCIDVGLASAYEGALQILEIVGDSVRVIPGD